jgi:hypothetical protein
VKDREKTPRITGVILIKTPVVFSPNLFSSFLRQKDKKVFLLKQRQILQVYFIYGEIPEQNHEQRTWKSGCILDTSLGSLQLSCGDFPKLVRVW